MVKITIAVPPNFQENLIFLIFYEAAKK